MSVGSQVWIGGPAASVRGSRAPAVEKATIAIFGNCAYLGGMLVGLCNCWLRSPASVVVAIFLAGVGILLEAVATSSWSNRSMVSSRLAVFLAVVALVVLPSSVLGSVLVWLASFVLIGRARGNA